jgi:DNA topoisomerase-2
MKEEKIVHLSDREHVLKRGTMWIGSVKRNIVEEYIFENKSFVKKEFEYVPGFITAFKEIISNSLDENLKTKGEFANIIKVEVNSDFISVRDNGRGIPSDNVEGLDVPASVAVFTNLKTGSNFSDDSTSIGQNGVGASLTQIFSKRFFVETCNNGKVTKLTCKNNGSDIKYDIKDKEGHYTFVEYWPDFERFSMTEIDDIHKDDIRKTIIDYSICFPDITFYFNGKKLAGNFKKYCEYYSSNIETFSYENIDICVYPGEYEQTSFVNGLNTKRGGNHVDLIVNKITYTLRELIAKKYKEIKPLDIKNKTCYIINFKNFTAPRFDSQTKENLINTTKEVQELINDIDFSVIAKKLYKNDEMMFPIIETFKIKEELKKRKDLKSKESKVSKKKIAKLIDANTTSRKDTLLFLAEGNSALSTFIEVRNPNEGGYPLRGKVISPQDTPLTKLMQNAEIVDILAALNLKLSDPSIDNMNFGKVVIMSDADEDGNSIACTLINFFYTFWPDMIKQGKLLKAISPIIVAKNPKTKEIKEFYNLTDYKNDPDFEILEVTSHNKGLGSLDKKAYRKMLDTLIEVTEDEFSRQTLDMAFGKDSQPRKEWLLA